MFAKFALHQSPQGFTALIFMITFLSGVLLLFLGVIGEYVGRIYEETKGRPLYLVGRVTGGGAVTVEEPARRVPASQGTAGEQKRGTSSPVYRSRGAGA